MIDPWNGAGTTTLVATQRGLEAAGFDANPALLVISKARLLSLEVGPSIEPLLNEIVVRAQLLRWEGEPGTDPLSTWFGPSAVVNLRSLERAIQHLLVETSAHKLLAQSSSVEALSSLASLFYVAMFATVRDLLGRFATTNPTWLKKPATLARRVRPSGETINETFKRNVDALSVRTNALAPSAARDDGESFAHPTLRVARSQSLPVHDAMADAIISSPPYCTRIDYVIATHPELAVLGYDAPAIRRLRDQMLGTPTITASPTDGNEWGETAQAFLRLVRGHRSRASAGYYAKYYTQYFDGLAQSLREMARVLKAKSHALIVVQDSFYKDIRLDLARVVGEIGSLHGLDWESTVDFPIHTTKAAVNPRARQYRKTFEATESVVLLRGGTTSL